MNAHPLVTIAIPAFNPEFFRSTLNSALSQDYPRLEVVVCDDSPDGRIEAICDALRVSFSAPLRYVRNAQRLGFSGNLQACLAAASGDLIKFLCDDDVLLAGCVSAQAQVMNDWPELSMVICQRLLCAADDVLLPSRSLNFVISMHSTVFNGTDLLASIADNAPNLFGGLSHCLLRRAQVEQYLATLVQDGQGFAARLDLALYACLLRRGHLCSLDQVLSLERVHHGRLSHQSSMTSAYKVESEWLMQMLAASTADDAPADGWVRCRPLSSYDGEPQDTWEELNLRRYFAAQMANFNQQVGSNSLSFSELYAEWLASRSLSAGQLRLLPKRIEQWPKRPRIVPVLFCQADEHAALRISIDCLAQQSYTAQQIVVMGPAQMQPAATGAHFIAVSEPGPHSLNHWLDSQPEADWIVLLRAGDRLHPHALVIMAERMALRGESLCLYFDEGAHDNLAPSSPVFKPDFNLDLMRSLPYVGRVLAFSVDASRTLGGFAPEFSSLAAHDLLWRMVEAHGLQVVEHIAQVLVQCQFSYADWLAAADGEQQALRVLQAHLQRLGVSARVSADEGGLLTRVTYEHPQTPCVSILVLAGSDLQSLTRCVESLLENTAYSNFELLLIANQDTPAQVQEWLAAVAQMGSPQLRCVTAKGLGGAANLNEASRYASGEYLLLLDGNCALFDKQWLTELLHHGQRPEVGLVGPKLLDKNGDVLSAGQVVGMQGTVASAFVACTANADSYMNRLRVVQNWSALSEDCLLIRRSLFDELGGFDINHLQHELLAADLCLRARSSGYLVVWTPFSKVARLAGGPYLPAAAEVAEADREAFYERWSSWVAFDPAYNPNLSLKLANFNFEPGLRTGWDPFIARAVPAVMALPTNATAIGHYRVIQPFNELEREGWIQGRIDYSASGLLELEREKPDVIIFQGRYSPEHLKDMAQFKRFSSARRIYELDDYIIAPPKKNDHARNLPGNMRELVSAAIGLCDRVVVSTEPLADALSSLHGDIRVVPNMLAASLWTGLVSARQRSAKPRVGWAGGTSHRGDLELLEGVVKAMAEDVDWVFFGMCPPQLRPYVKEFYEGIPFNRYPTMLASLNLDLALAPLEQNLFNDCKSNLRLLEYGACGFPVICTDTKAYAGYLPCTRVRDNTTEQWLEAIRMHLSDPLASYRQGDALREVVLRDYVLNDHHLQHWANAWLAD